MSFQARVRAYLAESGLAHTPQTHALDLASEVGEVAKALLEATGYGRSPVQPNPALREELGDALFSLTALAESLDIDLEDALHSALAKYRARLTRKGHSGSGSREPGHRGPHSNQDARSTQNR
jgi:NTP pyrophosphatase (non-canonical NTP hydrolase)